MKSLEDLKNALLTVTDNVGHYTAHKKTDKYIVWAEDGEKSVYADNKRSLPVITGTVDYFTKTEYDVAIMEIEKALGTVTAFSLNSVQREEDTGYIHYEWVWEGVVEDWLK